YKLNLFSYLKVRATFGYSGNVDQSKSAVTVLTYLSTNDYSNLPFAVISQYSNPELRWEKVGIFNIGIDFSMHNKRIAGSIEYYHKKGEDLFGPSPIDYTAGLNDRVVVRNIANMKGHGVDLTLHTKNIDQIFQWQTNFLINYYADKTTSYYIPPGSI